MSWKAELLTQNVIYTSREIIALRMNIPDYIKRRVFDKHTVMLVKNSRVGIKLNLSSRVRATDYCIHM